MFRLMDLMICAAVILPTAVLLTVLYIVVKCTSGGPFFFLQKRVGKNCRLFTIFKIRTMRAETSGATLHSIRTCEGDPRITSAGRWIRKLSLDELPQIFNVVKGDMSIVGVRPDTPLQRSEYTDDQWLERHKLRPGITGLAQVCGRSRLSPEERWQYDQEWVRRHSIPLYFWIIFQTVYSLFSRKNVN